MIHAADTKEFRLDIDRTWHEPPAPNFGIALNNIPIDSDDEAGADFDDDKDENFVNNDFVHNQN